MSNAALIEAEPKIDVNVVNNGTIITFYLNTPTAKQWANENVSVEDYMAGGNWDEASPIPAYFHCEHRYAGDIARGMLNAGLTA